MTDPVVMFVDRTLMVWFGLGLLIPFLIAGWPGLLWGGLIRYGYHNHVTFSVNSICHTFGDRPFDTPDRSRNNWLIGLLAFGEGWHNNHHAFPGMAYHGMGARQFDLNAVVIRLLGRMGLAWNIKQPSAELIARRRTQPSPEGKAIAD
jgi:stearoyl-CoA desaturase (delta-9 desaturase)